MAPEESTEVVLVRLDGRLAAVEKTVTRIEGSVERLDRVSREVYDNNRAADKDYAAETRRIAENARTVAWATASLLLLSIGAIFAIIKAVAG